MNVEVTLANVIKRIIGAFLATSVLAVILYFNSDHETDARLIGLSQASIIERLGNPREEFVFPLTKGLFLYEYQGDLHALLPKISEGDTVWIKELGWKTWYNTTKVWLYAVDGDLDGEWKSIDHLRWGKHIVF